MPRRFYFLLPFLALALTAPVRAEGAFPPVRDEFLANIFSDNLVTTRTSLVNRVAKYDSRDAALTLLTGARGLGDKIDGLLAKLAKVEKRHEEVNTRHDVKEDDYKTRTALRARMAELEKLILADREIFDVIEEACLGLKAEPAQGAIAIAATKGQTWYEKGLAARVVATYPTEAARNAALKALKDEEPRVVLQCLVGLTERKDPKTVAGIAACLKNKAWVVQTGAAEALTAIGSLKAVRPLIEVLAKTEGRVQHDINDALQKLTGQKLAPDYDTWKAWYEENKAKLEGEGAKPLGRNRGKKGEDDDGSFYGIPARSKRIVFLLDISGSMNKIIGGTKVVSPRPGEKEKPRGPKIEIAKKELKFALRKLPEDAYFNIITFNHLVKRWQKQMIPATQKNKNTAYLFIREIKATGSTFTYGALKEAFKLAGMGANDPNYDSGVDTIFLLSDGAPTDQSFPTSKLMDVDKILKSVRQWNKLHKVVIHAIAIDTVTQGSAFIKFMKLLASQNGGMYVERG